MNEGNNRQSIHVVAKGIVKDNTGKTLIVCRNGFKNPDGSDWWEFPGGTLEFGETPEQTLVRELREETGLDVVPCGLLYVWSAVIHEYQIIIITYLCDCEDASRVILSEEHSDYRWGDRDELRQFLAGDIQKALDANDIWNLL
ncbi:MAG: NUDIX domain-containing protein [Clostridia bacterium]|nr:NUDIX domain-containing protein [Clostridia bacterium]